MTMAWQAKPTGCDHKSFNLELIICSPNGSDLHFCLFAKQMHDEIFKTVPAATVESISDRVDVKADILHNA